MKKTGIFYGAEATKTAAIAEKIIKAFKGANIEFIAAEKAWKDDFESFDNLIIGTSTWFDGELPSYWDELIPILEELKMKNKRVAVFGLGDQEKYPDNFADGLGILADTFASRGASIVGQTSSEGYSFNHSKSLKNNKLIGLVLDIENQNDKTDQRIKSWVEQLGKEFQ